MNDFFSPNKAKNAHIPKAFVPKRRFLETWALYELPSFDPSLRTLQNLKKETREEKYKRLNSSKYFGEIVLVCIYFRIVCYE